MTSNCLTSRCLYPARRRGNGAQPARRVICCLLPLLAGMAWQGAGFAGADEFLLTNGARIQGEWLNPDQRPRVDYVMRTRHGVRLTLASHQVTEAHRQLPAEKEYERIAPGFGDAVEHQWALAEWCREHGLQEHRRVHLRRVIELDPNHAAAWRGLGYWQQAGQWVTQQQVLEQQGYVFYRGRWRLPQEVELMEEDRRVELAAKEWLMNLKLWRSQLGTEKSREALQNILATRDPLAISALTYLLQRDTQRPHRLLYIEVLGRIEDHRAVKVLTATALEDRDVEIVHACADCLVARKTPDLVKTLAEVLKTDNNERVNRAAHILGRLDDPDAVGPLIDALVTFHRYTVSTGRPAGTTTTGIVSSSANPVGTTFLEQGGTRGGTVRLPNREVLHALVRLSGGVSFGFDQQAWRNWHSIHANRQATQVSSLRE